MIRRWWMSSETKPQICKFRNLQIAIFTIPNASNNDSDELGC